MYLSRDILN